MYAIGTPVNYRMWQSDEWKTGTVISYWGEAVDSAYPFRYVDIKRDGFDEINVLSVGKLAGGAGSAFVTPLLAEWSPTGPVADERFYTRSGNV